MWLKLQKIKALLSIQYSNKLLNINLVIGTLIGVKVVAGPE
jgi:hypothetical protein